MRERVTPLFPIALSPAKLADVLGVRPEMIADAIKNDLLPAYRPRQGVKRHRVLVQDATDWIRNTWERV
jgi:hypothetical protein